MAFGVHTKVVLFLGALQCATSSMDKCKSSKAQSLSYCSAYNPDAQTPSESTMVRRQRTSDVEMSDEAQPPTLPTYEVKMYGSEAEHMQEILATAQGVAAVPLSQWLLNMAVTIWKSVGTELFIFAITCGFAVSARSQKGKRGATRECEGGAFPAASQEQRRSSPPARTSAPVGVSKAPPLRPQPVDRMRRSHDEAKQHVEQSAEKISHQREAWKIIDEMVSGCRTNANLKSAHRAIELYLELQQVLREQGSNVGEATWYARYSSTDVYNCMVQSVIRTSQCHLVDRLIDDMVRQGVPRALPFYESTMKQLAVQKHYQLALSVYDRMAADGVLPSLVMLSCLVSFSAEVGAYDRALDFFKQLTAQGKPSIRAYMTLLRVHSKRQDWLASIETFREMKQNGVPLDSLALNVVLSTAIAGDKVEEADMLIVEGHQMVPPISDSVSYNTLIKGYLQRSDLHMASKVVDRMQQHGIKPNSITFNTMMDRALRSFQQDQAWELYAMMRRCGTKPDKQTCLILIKGLDKMAQRDHVASCIELLQEVGHLCDAPLFCSLRGTLLDAAAQAGDPELLVTLQGLQAASPVSWRSSS